MSVLVVKGTSTLCNARGPISADRAPAICDDPTDKAYVYAIAVPKSHARLHACGGGTSWPLTRIATPAEWPSDLAVRVDNSNAGPLRLCEP